MLSQFLKC